MTTPEPNPVNKDSQIFDAQLAQNIRGACAWMDRWDVFTCHLTASLGDPNHLAVINNNKNAYEQWWILRKFGFPKSLRWDKTNNRGQKINGSVLRTKWKGAEERLAFPKKDEKVDAKWCLIAGFLFFGGCFVMPDSIRFANHEWSVRT